MSQTVYEALCKQIPDFKKSVENKYIKAIPLGFGIKFPHVKDYYNRNFSISDLKKNNGNIGLAVGSPNPDKNASISVIDIDGLTVAGSDKKDYYKSETAKYIYECLKEIPGVMIVKTQSGGHHLYIYNKNLDMGIHEMSESLYLPKDFFIEELQGKNLKQSIEIFTVLGSKQVVLPGSFTVDSNNNEYRYYEVVSELNTFEAIDVVDDVHELVKNTLLKHGFTYDKKAREISHVVAHDVADDNLRKLSDKDIDKVVNLLSPYFEKLDGQKHNSYLALGGYLCNHVTKSSAIKITKRLLKATKDFKGGTQNIYDPHVKTVLKNYERGNKNHTGLPTLLNNINSAIDYFTDDEYDALKFKLEKIINPKFKWEILVEDNGFQGRRYLVLDYNKNQIQTYTLKTNKKGEDYVTKRFAITDFVPLNIERKINLLEPNDPYIFTFKYIVNHENKAREIELDDSTLLTQELQRNIGLVLKPNFFKGVIDEVMGELSRLGVSETLEDIPIRGIFLHPHTGELIRAGKDGIVEIKKPSDKAVREGINIWKQLEHVYPYDLSKLSSIIRWGLVAPFSYIKKTKYEMIPMLFLYGASRTSKTTLAEIALSSYTEIDEEVSLGGSAADTLYRIEKALIRQGISVIINEPGHIIQDSSEMIDLLKSATESKYSREKMEKNGKHAKKAAYANICFTSNSLIPNDDALIRRIRFIEFDASERLSKSDMTNFRETFHYVNKRDNDFNKLRAIGDFIVWFVSQDPSILGLSEGTGELCDCFLNNLFDYAGYDKIDFLYTQTDYIEVEQGDIETLQHLKNMINNDLNRWIMNPVKLQQQTENYSIYDEVDVTTLDNDGFAEFDKNKKESIYMAIRANLISYLRLKNNKTGDKMIVITPSVTESLEKCCGDSKSCKSIASMMGHEYKTFKMSNGTTQKGFTLSYDEFKEFLN